MSSTSRPQATSKTNMQQGQSPAKPSQVESTNQLPNVQFNNQFNPSNMSVINTAQQLQFQSLSSIHQTAAFLQRQSQLIQHQQQQPQQQQPVESQLKNQPLSNAPLGNFHNFPELLNFFLMSNPNLNIPLPQLNPTQPPAQQSPLQTPKTIPASPSKSGQSQHTSPRSATTGSRSAGANIANAQTGEFNQTTVTPVTTPLAKLEQNTETPKQLPSVSPVKSTASMSTVSTPSSTISERLIDEVKERTSALQVAKKNSHDDTSALSTNATPPKAIGTSPETTKSPVPRRKQTNVTSPIKTNPTVSPSNSTVQPDSVTFSTPKKSEDVKSSSHSPSTPVAPVSLVSAPTTPITPPNKKVEPTKKEVQKSPIKTDEKVAKTPSTTANEKPATSSAKAVPASNDVPVPNDSDVKSKRNRFKTNLYQSPTPELVLATRMSVSEANKNSVNSKDKLILFFADEFLAVRSDEGSFYLCQCVYNMYKTAKKCRVRWLNEEENNDGTYKITFYDNIDKECILTSVSLDPVGGDSYKLTGNERGRIDNILKRSIDFEKGLPRPEVTEENPDGLDISLYNDESQIKTDEQAPTGHKRKSESSSKLVSPAKKAKQQTKTSSKEPSRRKNNNSSSVEASKKTKKRTKQSKMNLQRRSNAIKTTNPSPSDESNAADARNKKVAKTKKQTKSTASSPAVSSTTGPERTLRKRSKN